MKSHSFFASSKQILAVLLSSCLVWTSGGVLDAALAAPDVLAAPSDLPQFRLAPPGQLGRIADYFNADLGTVGAGLVPARNSMRSHSTQSRADTRSAPTSPLVILIQDLHAHYGVQKNIAGLLEFLSDKLNRRGGALSPPAMSGNFGQARGPAPTDNLAASIPFVLAVEGAQGPIDSSILALYPDAKVKEAASQFLMREGELSGAEYFAVKRGIPNLLVGVENGQYYELHRDLFRKSLASRQRLVSTLQNLQEGVKRLPRHIYHGDALKIYKILRAYEDSELSTLDLAAQLAEESRHYGVDLVKRYPDLAAYVSGAAIPSSSLRQATADFLTAAQNYLSSQEKKNLSILAKQQAPLPYYLYLRDLVYKHQLFLAIPPQLARYLEFVHTNQSLGTDRVVFQAKELAQELKRRAAKSQEEKNLAVLEHDLGLLLRLADLQATETEVQAFGPRLNQFIVLAKELVARAGGKSFDADELRQLLLSSIDYYAMALMRNEPMVENTLALMDPVGAGHRPRPQSGSNSKGSHPMRSNHISSNPNFGQARWPAPTAPRPAVAVLVAGGFHTATITELLRQKNISYIVITPMVDQISDRDHALYVKRLSGDVLTVEEIIQRASKFETAWQRKDLDPLALDATALETGLHGLVVGAAATASLLVERAALYHQSLRGQLGELSAYVRTHLTGSAQSIATDALNAAQQVLPGASAGAVPGTGGAMKTPGPRNALAAKEARELGKMEAGLAEAARKKSQRIYVDVEFGGRREPALVVSAKLPHTVPSYKFYDKDLEAWVIAVNAELDGDGEARNEAIFHEQREIYWQTSLKDESSKAYYSQEEAHQIASHETAQEFGKGGVSPLHRWQLLRMDPQQLEAIVQEYDMHERGGIHKRVYDATSLIRRPIHTSDMHQYESRFAAFTADVLKVKNMLSRFSGEIQADVLLFRTRAAIRDEGHNTHTDELITIAESILGQAKHDLDLDHAQTFISTVHSSLGADDLAGRAENPGRYISLALGFALPYSTEDKSSATKLRTAARSWWKDQSENDTKGLDEKVWLTLLTTLLPAGDSKLGTYDTLRVLAQRLEAIKSNLPELLSKDTQRYQAKKEKEVAERALWLNKTVSQRAQAGVDAAIEELLAGKVPFRIAGHSEMGKFFEHLPKGELLEQDWDSIHKAIPEAHSVIQIARLKNEEERKQKAAELKKDLAVLRTRPNAEEMDNPENVASLMLAQLKVWQLYRSWDDAEINARSVWKDFIEKYGYSRRRDTLIGAINKTLQQSGKENSDPELYTRLAIPAVERLRNQYKAMAKDQAPAMTGLQDLEKLANDLNESIASEGKLHKETEGTGNDTKHPWQQLSPWADRFSHPGAYQAVSEYVDELAQAVLTHLRDQGPFAQSAAAILAKAKTKFLPKIGGGSDAEKYRKAADSLAREIGFGTYKREGRRLTRADWAEFMEAVRSGQAMPGWVVQLSKELNSYFRQHSSVQESAIPQIYQWIGENSAAWLLTPKAQAAQDLTDIAFAADASLMKFSTVVLRAGGEAPSGIRFYYFDSGEKTPDTAVEPFFDVPLITAFNSLPAVEMGGHISENFGREEHEKEVMAIRQRAVSLADPNLIKLNDLKDLGRRLGITVRSHNPKDAVDEILQNLKLDERFTKTRFQKDPRNLTLYEMMTLTLNKYLKQPLMKFPGDPPNPIEGVYAIQSPWKFIFGEGETWNTLMDDFYDPDPQSLLGPFGSQARFHEAAEAVTPNKADVHEAIIDQLQRLIFGDEVDAMRKANRARIDATKPPKGLVFGIPSEQKQKYDRMAQDIASALSIGLSVEEVVALCVAASQLTKNLKDPFRTPEGQKAIAAIQRYLHQDIRSTVPFAYFPELFRRVSNYTLLHQTPTVELSVGIGTQIFFGRLANSGGWPSIWIASGEDLIERGIRVDEETLPQRGQAYFYHANEDHFVPFENGTELVIGIPRDGSGQLKLLRPGDSREGYDLDMVFKRSGLSISAMSRYRQNQPQSEYKPYLYSLRDWSRYFHTPGSSMPDMHTEIRIPESVARILDSPGRKEPSREKYERAAKESDNRSESARLRFWQAAQGPKSRKQADEMAWEHAALVRELRIVNQFPKEYTHDVLDSMRLRLANAGIRMQQMNVRAMPEASDAMIVQGDISGRSDLGTTNPSHEARLNTRLRTILESTLGEKTAHELLTNQKLRTRYPLEAYFAHLGVTLTDHQVVLILQAMQREFMRTQLETLSEKKPSKIGDWQHWRRIFTDNGFSVDLLQSDQPFVIDVQKMLRAPLSWKNAAQDALAYLNAKEDFDLARAEKPTSAAGRVTQQLAMLNAHLRLMAFEKEIDPTKVRVLRYWADALQEYKLEPATKEAIDRIISADRQKSSPREFSDRGLDILKWLEQRVVAQATHVTEKTPPEAIKARALRIFEAQLHLIGYQPNVDRLDMWGPGYWFDLLGNKGMNMVAEPLITGVRGVRTLSGVSFGKKGPFEVIPDGTPEGKRISWRAPTPEEYRLGALKVLAVVAREAGVALQPETEALVHGETPAETFTERTSMMTFRLPLNLPGEKQPANFGGMFINREWFRMPALPVEAGLGILTSAVGVVVAAIPHAQDPVSIGAVIALSGILGYLANFLTYKGLYKLHELFNPALLEGYNGRGVRAMMKDTGWVAAAATVAVAGFFAGIPILMYAGVVVAVALLIPLLLSHYRLNYHATYNWKYGTYANRVTVETLAGWLMQGLHWLWAQVSRIADWAPVARIIQRQKNMNMAKTVLASEPYIEKLKLKATRARADEVSDFVPHQTSFLQAIIGFRKPLLDDEHAITAIRDAA